MVFFSNHQLYQLPMTLHYIRLPMTLHYIRLPMTLHYIRPPMTLQCSTCTLHVSPHSSRCQSSSRAVSIETAKETLWQRMRCARPSRTTWRPSVLRKSIKERDTSSFQQIVIQDKCSPWLAYSLSTRLKTFVENLYFRLHNYIDTDGSQGVNECLIDISATLIKLSLPATFLTTPYLNI